MQLYYKHLIMLYLSYHQRGDSGISPYANYTLDPYRPNQDFHSGWEKCLFSHSFLCMNICLKYISLHLFCHIYPYTMHLHYLYSVHIVVYKPRLFTENTLEF